MLQSTQFLTHYFPYMYNVLCISVISDTVNTPTVLELLEWRWRRSHSKL